MKKSVVIISVVVGILIGIIAATIPPAQRGFAKGWMNIGYPEQTAIALGNAQLAAYLHAQIINGYWLFEPNGFIEGIIKSYLHNSHKKLEDLLPPEDKLLAEFLTKWMPVYFEYLSDDITVRLENEKNLGEVMAFFSALEKQDFSKKWLNEEGKVVMAAILLKYAAYNRGNFQDWSQALSYVEVISKSISYQNSKNESKSLPFYSLGKNPTVNFQRIKISIINNILMAIPLNSACDLYENLKHVKKAYDIAMSKAENLTNSELISQKLISDGYQSNMKYFSINCKGN